MSDSIRRQMERLLQHETDNYRRGHVYKWREIHPRHRLGRVKAKIQLSLARATQKVG